MNKIKPLFIWAGGKTKMLKYHAPHLPSTVNSYSEPFFGGGAMFLYILGLGSVLGCIPAPYVRCRNYTDDLRFTGGDCFVI